MKKTFQIIAFIMLFCLMAIFLVSKTNKTDQPQKTQVEGNETVRPTAANEEIKPNILNTKEEQIAAQETLLTFFAYLKQAEFEKALEYFDLDDSAWQDLANFSPDEVRGNRVKILENYCLAMGTCLRAEVLDIKNETVNEFQLLVQFINNDGNVYVYGPCCGATEAEMPSTKQFDFTVKKFGDTFKVTTPPLYRP